MGVYIVLLRHASYADMKCNPARRTIATESGVYYRSVSAATSTLVKRGLIEKQVVNLTPTKRVVAYRICEYPPKPKAPQAEKHGLPEPGMSAHPGRNTPPTQAAKSGHRSRDVGVETFEVETDRSRNVYHDPFSSIKCKHLYDGRQRLLLTQAFEKFQTSPTIQTLLGDVEILDLWLKVQQEVVSYHETRIHRELSCDYAGCIQLPAAKIASMAAAKSNPLGYLAASLKADLGKETDRAQEIRAEASRNRKGSGHNTPLDFKALLGNIASAPGSPGQ